MDRVKKVLDKIFDVVELYLPMLCFFMVFILYIIMILQRYLFFGKVGKYFELCQIMFIWCSVLCASYGGRTNGHICFGLLYDKVPATVQKIFRMIGTIVTEITFLIMLPYAYEAISFLKIKKSDLLRIPFNLIYAPFIAFIVLTIIHYGFSLVGEFKQMKKDRKETDQK